MHLRYKLILALLLMLSIGCQDTTVQPKRIEVATNSQYMLAFFNATWCEPCKKMKRDVWNQAEIKQVLRTKGVNFYPIDADNNPQYVRNYRVTGLPTTILFKAVDNGQGLQWVEIGRFVGYRDKEFIKQLILRLD